MRTGKGGYNRVNKSLKNRSKSFQSNRNTPDRFSPFTLRFRILSLVGSPFTKLIIIILKFLYFNLRHKPDSPKTSSSHHSKTLLTAVQSKISAFKKYFQKSTLPFRQPPTSQTRIKINSPTHVSKTIYSYLIKLSINISYLSDSIRHHFQAGLKTGIQNQHPSIILKLRRRKKQLGLAKKSAKLPPQFPPKLLLNTLAKILKTNLARLPKPKLANTIIFHRKPQRKFRLGPFQNNFLTKKFSRLSSFLEKPRQLKTSYTLTITSITFIAVLSNFFYQNIIKDLPDPTTLSSKQPLLTTKIYDRNGHLLYKIYKNENRSLVPISDIPTQLLQATLAIEDQNFYEHPGFSVRGIARAAKANVLGQRTEGGSTITQQLIKNTLLTSERTFTRKTKELILSVLTEFYYTKDEILTMYFNQVPYGGSAYGVQEAAQMYFGKNVKDLNLAQASFLAGLPAAPTYYSPYSPYPQRAQTRQTQVLRRMVEDGYITSLQSTIASKEKINLVPQQETIAAPHFVMHIKDLLAAEFGHQLVEQGGLEVVTSLDLNIQNLTEKIVAQEVENLHNLNVSNGAAIVTKPNTGEILAMVGSTNFFDTANDGQVNVTLRPRQPGSSIKPLTYSMALENGLTPASIIPDTPICFHDPHQPPYCPKNYDGNFHGRVTLRNALANSYNIPAVKTLAQFSVNQLIQHGQKLGITTWDQPNRFGLALTLGGGEVKMTDMAVAYGTFANLGIRVDLNPILKVTSFDGKIIHQSNCSISGNCNGTRALDPRVAYQITDILSDNNARSQAFGRNSVLNITNQQVAVKTGTTNSLRDNWTIGYTQDYLVATWVGNNNNTPMRQIASGLTGASPIWNKILTNLINPQTNHRFSPPANLVKVNICTITGTLACNGCPSKEELFLPGTQPTSRCSSEQIARILNPHPPELQNN